MNELAVRNAHAAELAEFGAAQQYQSQTIARLTDWANEARAAGAIAKSLCDTEFVPKHFRGNAASTTAAILTGFELGLPPMAALRSLYVIGGTPAMYAATMRGLLQSHGHQIWEEEMTATRVIVAGRRRGSDKVQRSTWTIDRAKTAELLTNAHYRKNPQNMLTARATAEVCRLVASDLLHACPYAVEELDDGAADVPEAAPAKPARRKMQRAQVAQTPPPEPEFETDTAEDPITKDQLTKLHVMLGKAGYGDRDEGLAYLSVQAGRDVASSKELSKREAMRIIDRLEFPDDPDNEPPSEAEPGGE